MLLVQVNKGDEMDSNSESTTTKYQQVTVEVPEDRIAEFHAFFARFLAGPAGRGRRGRGRRYHHGFRGLGCTRGRGAAERGEAAGQTAEITEV
jgi:hypothetical protein